MTITVEGISGAAYRIAIGRHEVVVDQPAQDGGEDRGPTPTDLFVAGLAGCAAFYAGKFLSRRGVAIDAVRAHCEYEITHEAPARVAWISVSLELPPGLSEDVRAAALRAADHCTVHNSLSEPPALSIQLQDAAAAA